MTHIGPSVVFDGDLSSDEDLTIDGRLNGSIHLREGTLVVGRSARISATLRAPRITVHGTVEGTVTAGERIELASSAVVTGDISATHIVIADGAQFNGRVDMAQRTIAVKVAQFKAAGG